MTFELSWRKLVAILLFLAFMAWNPVTRQVFWIVLPLGAKPDDLAFVAIALLCLAIVIFTLRGILPRNPLFNIIAWGTMREKRKNENL